MTQPADNLEYGTIIKDGELFRLYTRHGRGARFDGDTTEVTRYCEERNDPAGQAGGIRKARARGAGV